MATATQRHTPGPWKAEDSGTLAEKPGWRTVVRNRTRLIAYTGSPLPIQNRGWQREDEANARLIAAAPDLLEACQQLVDRAYSEHFGTCGLDNIRAAIAKATSPQA